MSVAGATPQEQFNNMQSSNQFQQMQSLTSGLMMRDASGGSNNPMIASGLFN